MKMKILLMLLVTLTVLSCNNQDKDFDDYGLTTTSFPYQRPARSLILGKYDLGFNTNDNNHRFEIGVTMSGVYENTKNREVYFELAPELLDSVSNVKALPSEYYTIETTSPVTIPAGSSKGRISVQLTDAFFDDSLSFAYRDEVHYVVPLRIVSVDGLDSILSGYTEVVNPLKVRDEDWETLPKDYTLYGIKFINKYHAVYLRRGVDQMTKGNGTVVNSTYHDQYVERDELVVASTTGKGNVELSNLIRRGSEDSPGYVNMELVFDDQDQCTIRSFDGERTAITGTGMFKADSESWGGKTRDAIYLTYQYTDAINNETHIVNDTLVCRDRDVVFEEFLVEF